MVLSSEATVLSNALIYFMPNKSNEITFSNDYIDLFHYTWLVALDPDCLKLFSA